MKKSFLFKNFRLLAKEIQCVFSSNFLTHIAKETQFVQRTSNFRAQELVALCIGMGQDIARHSLTRLCEGRIRNGCSYESGRPKCKIKRKSSRIFA